MLQNPVAFFLKWQLNIATPFYARIPLPSCRVLFNWDFSLLNQLRVALALIGK